MREAQTAAGALIDYKGNVVDLPAEPTTFGEDGSPL